MKINIIPLLSICVSLISIDVFANSNSVPSGSLSECMKISNAEQRLVCFDRLASKGSVPLDSAQLSEEAKREEERKIEKERKINAFSIGTVKKSNKEKTLDSITGTISKLEKRIRGQWVIYLKNNQKWQQTDTAHLKLAVGDSVILKKGSLSAVYLFKTGNSRNIRVKRLE